MMIMMDDSQEPQVPEDDAFAGMFDDDVDDGFGDENSADTDADSTDGHAIGSGNASATDGRAAPADAAASTTGISDDSGNATYRAPDSFLEDMTSGFLRARTDAQGKFAPKLIANTHGNTMVDAIKQELAQSDSFDMSVAFVSAEAIKTLFEDFRSRSANGRPSQPGNPTRQSADDASAHAGHATVNHTTINHGDAGAGAGVLANHPDSATKLDAAGFANSANVTRDASTSTGGVSGTSGAPIISGAPHGAISDAKANAVPNPHATAHVTTPSKISPSHLITSTKNYFNSPAAFWDLLRLKNVAGVDVRVWGERADEAGANAAAGTGSGPRTGATAPEASTASTSVVADATTSDTTAANTSLAPISASASTPAPIATTASTRAHSFHPKGYVFTRRTEHGQPYVNLYVGSSNLTQAALTDRQREWNLRVSSLEGGDLIDQVRRELDGQIADSAPLTEEWIRRYEEDFKRFAPPRREINAQIERDKAAPITPNAMQVEALMNLAKLRREGERRAIIISATGTGKTILSAFDVKAMNPRRMLYVTESSQILEKSMESYQRVLGCPESDLGLYGGERRESDRRYVFATRGMMGRQEILDQFAPDEFDYILIDEVHHAGAASYRRIIDHFSGAKFMLGMTATPERTDGANIFELFDYNVAYEIRLQRALDENMLCPFHYYGVAEYLGTQEAEVRNGGGEGEVRTVGRELQVGGSDGGDWQGSDQAAQLRHEIAELASEERVRYIIDKLQQYTPYHQQVTGLVFCSSQEEARRLSRLFNRHVNQQAERPYRTVAVTSEDENGRSVTQEQRGEYIHQLEAGELDYIFTVNLFNEGVDIPTLNQIVMLRNTESSIVFTQQLGRGLRKAPHKDSVIVIDFIGNYANNYLIPVALYGNGGNPEVERKSLQRGTIGLSSISFDEIARERVLASLDAADWSEMKKLRDAYQNLRFRLGRVPMLIDIYMHDPSMPHTMASKKGDYLSLAASFEARMTGRKGSGRKGKTTARGGEAQSDRTPSAVPSGAAAAFSSSVVLSGAAVTSTFPVVLSGAAGAAESKDLTVVSRETSRAEAKSSNVPRETVAIHKPSAAQAAILKMATTVLLRGLRPHELVMLDELCGFGFGIGERTIGLGDDASDAGVSRETSHKTEVPTVSRETQAVTGNVVLSDTTPNSVVPSGSTPSNVVPSGSEGSRTSQGDDEALRLASLAQGDKNRNKLTQGDKNVSDATPSGSIPSNVAPSTPAFPVVLSDSTPGNVTPNDSTPSNTVLSNSTPGNVVLSDSEGPRDAAGIPVATLAAIIAKRFPSADLSPTQIESALRVLTYEHFTKPTRKSYGDAPLIEIIDARSDGGNQATASASANANPKHPSIMDTPAPASTTTHATTQTATDNRRVRLSPGFARMLRDDRTFRAFLADTVRVGLLNCRDLFAEARRQQRTLDHSFLVEQRYSLADVMRLCGWTNANTPQNVGGYSLDLATGTMPIMVKYASSQYEDEFLGPQEMRWYSKNRQTPQSTVFRWLRGELDGEGASAGTAAATGARVAAPTPRTGEITRTRTDACTANANAGITSHTNAGAGSLTGMPAPVLASARWEDTHFVPLFVMRRADAERATKRSETPYYYYVGHVTAVEHPTITQKPSADGKSPINVTVSTLRLSQPLEPELFRHLTGKHSM